MIVQDLKVPRACAGSVVKNDDLGKCVTMVGWAPVILLKRIDSCLDERQELQNLSDLRTPRRHSPYPASCLAHVDVANLTALTVCRHYVFPGDVGLLLHANASGQTVSVPVLAISAPGQIR